MQELIKEFKETGPCLVDVEKVVSAWNDKFFISQYQDKYTLIEQIELFKEERYKCVISEEQAVDIIKKASLLQIKSTFFTIDFIELLDGTWVARNATDGNVSIIKDYKKFYIALKKSLM